MTDEKIDRQAPSGSHAARMEYCDDTGHHPSDIVQRTRTGVPVVRGVQLFAKFEEHDVRHGDGELVRGAWQVTWKQPPQCPQRTAGPTHTPWHEAFDAPCVGHGGRHEAQYPGRQRRPKPDPVEHVVGRRSGGRVMMPLTADPLAEAIARTILRHQLGCDQPAQPPAWMVAAASKTPARSSPT